MDHNLPAIWKDNKQKWKEKSFYLILNYTYSLPRVLSQVGHCLFNPGEERDSHTLRPVHINFLVILFGFGECVRQSPWDILPNWEPAAFPGSLLPCDAEKVLEQLRTSYNIKTHGTESTVLDSDQWPPLHPLFLHGGMPGVPKANTWTIW